MSSSKIRRQPTEAIANEDLCFVCQVSLATSSEKDLTPALGARQVCHKRCYNGQLALRRVVEKLSETVGVEARDRLNQLTATDITTWRALSCSLAASAYQRSGEQRGKVRKFVEELVSETRVVRRAKRLLLTESQFKAWYVVNENLSAAAAAAKWQANSTNQHIYKERRSADGALLVSVELPPEIMVEESLAKRRRMTESSELQDPSDIQRRMHSLQSLSSKSCSAALLGGVLGGGALAAGDSSTTSGSSLAPLGGDSADFMAMAGGGCMTNVMSPQSLPMPVLDDMQMGRNPMQVTGPDAVHDRDKLNLTQFLSFKKQTKLRLLEMLKCTTLARRARP